MSLDNSQQDKNEQGCCLDESTRLEYLQAMGIQPWYSKFEVESYAGEQPAVADSALSSKLVEESSKQADSSVARKSETTDLSNYDWNQLQQAVSQCQLCELHSTRTRTVFGVGNQQADLLIIGEAPGEEEDQKGEPFVGRAGQLLDAMMHAIGLDRQKVYIANILKCRPPNNRNPHVSETVCCDPYLQQQIKLLQPKLILALGRIAAHHLLVSQESLAALRQKQYSYNGIPLLVSYHPAYLLRKPVEKRKSWQDLQDVKRLLNKT